MIRAVVFLVVLLVLVSVSFSPVALTTEAQAFEGEHYCIWAGQGCGWCGFACALAIIQALNDGMLY